MVLGGCYSGQILLWDMKGNKTLPVQRSSMSGKGHKHPDYAMAMITFADEARFEVTMLISEQIDLSAMQMKLNSSIQVKRLVKAMVMMMHQNNFNGNNFPNQTLIQSFQALLITNINHKEAHQV